MERNNEFEIKTPNIAAIILIVLFLAIGVFMITSLNRAKNTPPKAAAVVQPAPKSKATFTAKITDYVPENPADLKFYATVTNTGDVAGKPSCTVKAHDDSSTYYGIDSFDLSTVKPGKSLDWKGDLTITGQGATYVTQVTISC